MDGRKHGAGQILVVSGVALALAAAALGPLVLRHPRPPRQSNVSCPHDAPLVQRVDSHLVARMRLTGPISNAPEYHDCQRLLEDTSGEYGTLAGIYASWTLNDLVDSVERTRSAVAAAEIYAWDGDYPRLGIRQGFNCLYMMPDIKRREIIRWRAWVIPVRERGDQCTAPLDPNDPGAEAKELRVGVVQSALHGQDVPAVARWDWNPTNNSQTIGIKCDINWCIVGDSVGFGLGESHDLHSMPSLHNAALSDGATDFPRVVEVRGWYDEQRLDPATGPKVAGDVIGTVIPHPSLVRYSRADFEPVGTFLPAAFVVLRATNLIGNQPRMRHNREIVASYLAKYNFALGMNRVSLCAGAPHDCVPAGTTAPSCTPAGDDQWTANDEAWTARVVSGATPTRPSTTRYFCVRRCKFADADMAREPSLALAGPGTARWRWKAHDATLWTSCPKGCCQLGP